MRIRTAGLGIAAIMAAATAGCAGASAVDGPAPVEQGEGQLPRVADDSELGGDPSVTSAVTEAPDRATTVVPAPPRPGRGNVADDPYLPPRAVIPADPAPAAPPAPPSSTPPAESTAPSEAPESTEPTRPTMPTPQRPKPLLPPYSDDGTMPGWPFGAPNDGDGEVKSGETGESGDDSGARPETPETAEDTPDES